MSQATFNYRELSAQAVRAGMSRKELAEKMGVHVNTISNWMNGHVAPDPFQLMEVLMLLGRPIDGLLLTEYYTPPSLAVSV